MCLIFSWPGLRQSQIFCWVWIALWKLSKTAGWLFPSLSKKRSTRNAAEFLNRTVLGFLWRVTQSLSVGPTIPGETEWNLIEMSCQPRYRRATLRSPLWPERTNPRAVIFVMFILQSVAILQSMHWHSNQLAAYSQWYIVRDYKYRHVKLYVEETVAVIFNWAPLNWADRQCCLLQST
jgi:hypothetical protein